MKRTILFLMPVLLLAACGQGSSTSQESGKLPISAYSGSNSNVGVGKPGAPSSTAKDPLKTSMTISMYNRQSMIAGEGNQLKSNRFGFDYDVRAVFNSPETMNKGLAKLGLLFSAEQYDYLDVNTYTVSLWSSKIDFTNNTMAKLDLKDITTYKVSDYNFEKDPNDVVGMKLSHAEIDVNGAKKNLVVVSFAGTTTDKEWKSNLDVGSTVNEYMNNASEHPEWTNHKHHKGIDVAKNRAAAKIDAYVKEKITNSNPTTYFISGHSRGAGVANLYGKDLIDAKKNAVVYAFNGPNVVELENNIPTYNTIFNFENTDDILSAIPPKNSKFTKYGKTYSIDFVNPGMYGEPFKEEFKSKMSWDYNALTTANLNSVTNTLNEIMLDRNSLYSFNTQPLANDKVTIANEAAIQSTKEKIIAAAQKYGCENKIKFNEPTKIDNTRYSLTWIVSNSIVLDLVSKFLSHEIELDMNNFTALMQMYSELSTFVPTLASKLFNTITYLTSDLGKLAIPHTPETFMIGIEYALAQ